MSAQTNEARVIIAIEAIQSSKKLSRRAAARFYNVPEPTIRDRMNGVTPIAERRPAVQLLTEIEEDGIVQYILDLDTRGFSPRVEMLIIWKIHPVIAWDKTRREALGAPLHQAA